MLPFREVNKEDSLNLVFYFFHIVTKISYFHSVSNSFLRLCPDGFSEDTGKYLGLGKKRARSQNYETLSFQLLYFTQLKHN